MSFKYGWIMTIVNFLTFTNRASHSDPLTGYSFILIAPKLDHTNFELEHINGNLMQGLHVELVHYDTIIL